MRRGSWFLLENKIMQLKSLPGHPKSGECSVSCLLPQTVYFVSRVNIYSSFKETKLRESKAAECKLADCGFKSTHCKPRAISRWLSGPQAQVTRTWTQSRQALPQLLSPSLGVSSRQPPRRTCRSANQTLQQGLAPAQGKQTHARHEPGQDRARPNRLHPSQAPLQRGKQRPRHIFSQSVPTEALVLCTSRVESVAAENRPHAIEWTGQVRLFMHVCFRLLRHRNIRREWQGHAFRLIVSETARWVPGGSPGEPSREIWPGFPFLPGLL